MKRQRRAEAESNALPLGRTGVYSVMSVTSFSVVRCHKGGIRLRELYALTIVCQTGSEWRMPSRIVVNPFRLERAHHIKSVIRLRVLNAHISLRSV